MPNDNAAAWDQHAAAYQQAAQLTTDVARYGLDIGTEADFRLCGNLKGKRVLELGCGGGQSAIAFARQGAHVIGVDISAEQLSFARRLIEREGVKVDLRHGDLADLAFVRADTMDLVFSSGTFDYVEDLDRVFRQAHRVLRTEAPLVFSLAHPAADVVVDDVDPMTVSRSYFDRTPIEREWGGTRFTYFRHTIADLFASLTRANFRVDTVLEPEPAKSGPRSERWRPVYEHLPSTLVIRARKQGI